MVSPATIPATRCWQRDFAEGHGCGRGLHAPSYSPPSPGEHPGCARWPQAQQKSPVGTRRGGRLCLVRLKNRGAYSCQGGSDLGAPQGRALKRSLPT